MAKKIPVYQLGELIGEPAGIALFNFAAPPLEHYSSEIARPHRHDHYCCFFIEEGQMDFQVDFQPVQIKAKSILVSYPGQVHESDGYSKCSGWMLVFDAKLVDEEAKMTIEGTGRNTALITLAEEESKWFTKLLELLNSAAHDRHESTVHAQMLRSLLNAFVAKICIFRKAQENTQRQSHSSRSVDIVYKFRHLLKESFRTEKRPSVYAAQMNFSVSYLNDTVKEVTGFSLTYFIQQEVIAEAQRLLYYSEMTVREIAYALGYEDDKYFIRVFGKVTGVSPANFRKRVLKTVVSHSIL